MAQKNSVYKITAHVCYINFLSSHNRYFLGSLAEVVGIARTGINFLLWLDNGDKVAVPPSHDITVLQGG